MRINGSATYLANKRSVAHVGELFAFRNPPHFVSFLEPARRDAIYETDFTSRAHSLLVPAMKRMSMLA